MMLVPSHDTALLLPILRDAEEGDARLVSAIEAPTMTSYIAQTDTDIVGAVVMHWQTEESEIVYIATAPSLRGQGYGKAMMQLIIKEARQRGVQTLSVGTSNASWSNIAFYQKCGFRMHSVRRDFFIYIPMPMYEDGIRMQDMLMLHLDLGQEDEDIL